MRHPNLAALTAIGILATAQAAAAADISRPAPAKAPPVPYVSTAPYNWTGVYFGGHLGGGWSDASYADPTGAHFGPAGAFANLNGAGFLGGPQLGYNWQTGNWVFGVQGDASFTGISPSGADPFVANTSIKYSTDWLATVSGRVGYAWNNILWYGKGGAAWVHNTITGVAPGINASGNNTEVGWLAGTGLEYGFAPNWTAFVEYDYIGVGNQTIVTSGLGVTAAPVAFKQDIQMVKGGVNFKFNLW